MAESGVAGRDHRGLGKPASDTPHDLSQIASVPRCRRLFVCTKGRMVNCPMAGWKACMKSRVCSAWSLASALAEAGVLGVSVEGASPAQRPPLAKQGAGETKVAPSSGETRHRPRPEALTAAGPAPRPSPPLTPVPV